MNIDIISLRILLVTPSASLRNLLRQGAGQASVPAEVMEATNMAEAEPLITQGSDVLLFDCGLPAAEKVAICQAARAAKERPFVIAIGNDIDGLDIDGCVRNPETEEDAQKIADGCIRSRIPLRVLVVDDSSTMRGIVRKILSASKFPLEIKDTHDGAKALQELRDGVFDIAFVDYNMPGLDGFEVLSELQRLQSRVVVVLMTSTDNPEFAGRAQTAGAAAFLKKPFFPGDIDTVIYRLYDMDAPRCAASVQL
jgi:CheY-like chemotaxis protein